MRRGLGIGGSKRDVSNLSCRYFHRILPFVTLRVQVTPAADLHVHGAPIWTHSPAELSRVSESSSLPSQGFTGV
jgi:hypothetical protein